MSPSRLATAVLAALLATACATALRRRRRPAPVTAAPGAGGPSTPNSRAMLLFEDATKAAEAQAKSGQRDDAALERRFQAVQQADPTFAEADYNLGVLAERQGKRDQAFALYRSALQKKPSLKPAAEGLARLTRAQGDLPSAIAQWNDVARAFPDDAESRAQLAELYRLTAITIAPRSCRARR
jgi:tetratricopeptide (TPR) repeat protein